MCLGMLLGIYFWYGVVLNGRQGSLLDGLGLESAYLWHNCFGSATTDKMTHQSWNLLNDYNWNCPTHTLDLHEVDELWGFCNCSCDGPESSFGSTNLKSGHICCILCIGTSFQGIGIPVHEWSHHICYSSQASCVFFYCHMVS